MSIKEYDIWSRVARSELSSSMINNKVITQVTCYIKNKKWIANKTLEKWKKELNDPLQPDKKADDTTWITKHKNMITFRYKKPLIYNKETQKLEEYGNKNA